MTIQALREFLNHHNASTTGLAALVAALDAKASGVPLDPALGGRVQDLLSALGAGDILDNVSVEEARPLVPEIRHQLALDAKLLYAESRATSWNYADPRLLQDVGDFARGHAHAITQKIVPALEGLPQRFATKDAKFLDIGVGVAGTAIAMAQLWPELHVVGIDVWQPALALARSNVDQAALRDRIELREQAAETLEDNQAFDLAWMPVPFIPERVIPTAIERTHRSLRPGGWVIVAYANAEGLDPVAAAIWRLRVTTFGGPQWAPKNVEASLQERGFVDVRTFPRPPGVPVGLTVGRRPLR